MFDALSILQEAYECGILDAASSIELSKYTYRFRIMLISCSFIMNIFHFYKQTEILFAIRTICARYS